MGESVAGERRPRGSPRPAPDQAASAARRAFRRAPADAHEWVTFEDPEELRTWVFDVTFLLSRWQCIFAAGCQGVLTGPAPEMVQGCCSYGAHFTDRRDEARVKAAAKTLTDDDWQFRSEGRRNGVVETDRDGARVTRLVDGACIFLNRPGFARGPGCALHQAAWDRGRKPLDLKPDVCWQLPLHRDEDVDSSGHVTSTIGQWDRRHWGAGGDEFHWWCTEAPEAFSGSGRVFQTMRDELVEMVGPAVYSMLRDYLVARMSAGTPLPHPVARAKRA